jgi:hypothetical protein
MELNILFILALFVGTVCPKGQYWNGPTGKYLVGQCVSVKPVNKNPYNCSITQGMGGGWVWYLGGKRLPDHIKCDPATGKTLPASKDGNW